MRLIAISLKTVEFQEKKTDKEREKIYVISFLSHNTKKRKKKKKIDKDRDKIYVVSFLFHNTKSVELYKKNT